VKGRRIKIEDLEGDRFVLFHRKDSPALYDSIIGLCRERGFSPKIDNEPDTMQTVLSLVSAEQGVSIVPACALNLRCGLYAVAVARQTFPPGWHHNRDGLRSPLTSSFLAKGRLLTARIS
jgi:DNA-binding transcriptional LysR family regulator